MSDREQRYVEPDEGLREEPRRTYHEERQTIDYTGPVTRLVGVAGAVAMVVFGGFWLETIGLGEEFGTIAVIALVFSLGYWADKRPDRLERRAGPFWRIASAVRESRADLKQYTYERPLRVAISLSICYGIAIVLLKSALVGLLASLYDWKLAAALGAAIGAAVVAPSFFRDLWSKISEGPADYARYHRERRDEREADASGEEWYAADDEYDRERDNERED